MASQVDATIPADNVKVEKSEVRSNFATIRDEITQLQRQTRKPWQIAFGTVSLGAEN